MSQEWKKKIVVAITGASGSIYAKLLLDQLEKLNAQVEEVAQELFPLGTDKLDQAEVLRAVFLHLKRRNSAGNEGR